MRELINVIENKRGFLSSKPVSDGDIKAAEEALSLRFSDEYRDYLKRYGEVSFFGHELTGLTESKRLNVIDVTDEEKALNGKIGREMYVVEQANIDGIVIWQSEDGTIYRSLPGEAPVKIHSSLSEYIMSC